MKDDFDEIWNEFDNAMDSALCSELDQKELKIIVTIQKLAAIVKALLPSSDPIELGELNIDETGFIYTNGQLIQFKVKEKKGKYVRAAVLSEQLPKEIERKKTLKVYRTTEGAEDDKIRDIIKRNIK